MNMPMITSEDKVLIEVLRVEKGWIVDRMMLEFPARRKIDQTGSTDRLSGSGRPRSVHSVVNFRNISGSFAKNI